LLVAFWGAIPCRGQGSATVAADPAEQLRKTKAAQPASTEGPVTTVPEDFAKVKLSPGMLLRFGVFDAPQMDANLRVGADGSVQVPLAGTIPVVGLSVEEARAQIKTALIAGEFFKNPQVNLDIAQLAPGYVTILGEVQTPGKFQVLTAIPLQTALALTGGESVEAGNDIQIQHAAGGEIEHVRNGREPGNTAFEHAMVAPGDTITVLRAGIVYVLGSVHRPGGYLMVNRGSLNVLEALSLAGGSVLEAANDSIRILHRHDNQIVEETIKLSDYTKGTNKPPTLVDADIVYVPSNKLKSILVNGSNLIAATAAALVYRVP
jgi:polysaccharide export outer membrane protein